MYDQQPPPWASTPPPAGPGGSAIALTAKYSWVTFVLGLFKVFVTINGHQVAARWGRTVIPVPPGQHHVHVHVPYLLPPRIGPADTVVPVHPGQVVEVEYRAPLIGWLGGSLGPVPQQWRGVGASIALMVVPLVALLCVCGMFAFIGLIGDDADEPVTFPTIPAYTAPAPRTSTTTAPGGSEPTLRSTPARTLVGPSYAASDKTYTMTLNGFPYAFRTPATWGCLPGKIDVPDAKAWVCLDEGNPFDASAPEPDRGKRLQIMLRPCDAPCGQAERTRLSTEWFDEGAKAKTQGDRTWYAETARNGEGRYILDMSHFVPATGTPQFQVAVGVYSQPESKAVVQKIVNDIFTQAG